MQFTLCICTVGGVPLFNPSPPQPDRRESLSWEDGDGFHSVPCCLPPWTKEKLDLQRLHLRPLLSNAYVEVEFPTKEKETESLGGGGVGGADALEGLRHMQAGEAPCSESGLFIYCREADPLQGISWVRPSLPQLPRLSVAQTPLSGKQRWHLRTE